MDLANYFPQLCVVLKTPVDFNPAHHFKFLFMIKKIFQIALLLTVVAWTTAPVHAQKKLKGQLYQLSRSILRNWRVCELDKKPLYQELSTLLEKTEKLLTQQRGGKDHLYSVHAEEVECIGKGKAHKPWEFGVKVSIVTTEQPSPAGQFVLDARALPGNPYDGHTLDTVLTAVERITGVRLKRVLVDQGYKGHNAPDHLKDKVFRPGLKRGVTATIRKALKRRNAIEPVIGHLKHDHRMGRCYLKGSQGDALNAMLAAVGYNFARLLRWLRLFLRFFLDGIRRRYWLEAFALPI